MSQDDLLEYLKKYVVDPKVITFEQLTDSEKQELPSIWLNIVAKTDQARIAEVLSCWKSFEIEFEQVVEYLRENLVSLDLVHHGFGYSLIYGVKSLKSRKILYYEARNPKTMNMNPMILKIWEGLPNKFKSFYQFHNGWFYLASGSMGLSAVEDFFFLDEEDWSIIDELDEVPLDLGNTLAVYTNGMGGYVCLDAQDSSLPGVLWWAKKPPKLNMDFWALVDSWTVMGFDE